MEIKTLSKFNEWWLSNKVRLTKPYKRKLYSKLIKFTKDRQAILVSGLRRVGKTTLLYQIIQELLNQKVKNTHILYFSFDEERYDIEDVIETYKNEILQLSLEDANRIYLFFDEIQKVEAWEDKLKVYYDLYPNLKFFLSGSASLNLQKTTRESLAGRILEFNLKPLTFKEFLEMQGFKIEFKNIKIYENKVLPKFFNYIRKAGFPELVNENNDDKIRLYIKNSVIERIAYRDLPLEFGVKDLELLESIVNLIFKEPGLILNFDSLSKDLKKDKKTIINYIYYLKYGMLINVIFNFRESTLSASRKLKKAYPNSTAFIFSLSDKFYEEDFFGKVLETFIINEIDAKYYYRKNGEVDIIWKVNKKIIPIEVKVKADNSDINKFLKIMTNLKSKKGIIVTKSEFKEIVYRGIKIKLVPAWAFALFWEKYLR